MIQNPDPRTVIVPRAAPSDDPQAEGVCVFRNMEGFRVAVRPKTVEAVVELDQGCTIVTGTDVYRVNHAWPEVSGLIWPELFR